MSINAKYSNHLKIIRPFLYFKKMDLKYVTLNYFKTYIKDPTNEDEKFLRVRVRKYRKDMEREGLDTRKIIKTVDNLVSANQALNFYKNKALYKHTSFVSKNRCLINKKIFSEEAGEIIFKSFSDILSLVSGTYYPPRSKKVINLIARLRKNKFTKSTLGGCVVEKKDNFILISKELKLRKMSYQLEK
jgi:tRNA(Ile)-lysidine synthase